MRRVTPAVYARNVFAVKGQCGDEVCTPAGPPCAKTDISRTRSGVVTVFGAGTGMITQISGAAPNGAAVTFSDVWFTGQTLVPDTGSPGGLCWHSPLNCELKNYKTLCHAADRKVLSLGRSGKAPRVNVEGQTDG